MPNEKMIGEEKMSGNDISCIKDTYISSTTPEELFGALMNILKDDYSDEQLQKIEKAYNLANAAHKEQRRKSGEPYIVHPLCVAIILAKLHMDADTIIGGILHDIVEDTEMTKEGVAQLFGDDVAYLVEGVTKLTNFSWSADKTDKQAENLRKMFIAMARDIRVVIIKLADRLHNMRTLQYMKPEKQQEKARETRDIYAPIAHRLGISRIKVELDDLAIKYLEPDVYDMLKKRLEDTRQSREQFMQEVSEEIKEHLKHYGLEAAHVEGRVKHFFSIYKKMVNQDKTVEQVDDVFAIKIIVDSEKDCYAALGAVHELYKPILGKFRDYIAMPKANMYRSLHTTVISKNGQPFDIQIRTWDMQKVAEYGITAHWQYKDGDGDNHADAEKNKMLWLREILELHNDMEDNHEFLSLVKNDLDIFNDMVHCFTPTGEHKTLPKGSTIVDFAYSVHTAVGNRMVGAKVNGKLTPVDYVIQNGDRIEILDSDKSTGPSKEWLGFVKSAQARSKINQWFRSQNRDDNILKGRKAIESYCEVKSINLGDILKPQYMEKIYRKYGYSDWDSVLAAIGHGSIKEGQIVNKLTEEYIGGKLPDALRNQRQPKNNTGVMVKDDPFMETKLSRCCSPVPGDDIIGYCTNGGIISVHRKDCTNLQSIDTDKLVDVEWIDADSDIKYNAGIDVIAENRPGMLARLSSIAAEKKIDIRSLNIRSNKKNNSIIMSMHFEIADRGELVEFAKALRAVDGVLDVVRTIIK